MASTKSLVIDMMQECLSEGASVKDAIVRVAEKTGKSPDSVRGCWYRNRPPSERFHHNQVMNPSQEQMALAMFHAFAMSNMPLYANLARSVIKEVLGVDMSRSTFYAWLKRHESSIKLRKPKDISKKRIGLDKMDEIKDFVDQVEPLIGAKSNLKVDIVNYDETSLDFSSDMGYVINKTGAAQTNLLASKNRQRCSILPFVLSTGPVFMSVVIVQGRPGDPDGFFEPQSGDKCYPTIKPTRTRLYLYRTENGKLRQEDFGVIMDEFARQWVAQFPGRRVLVFGDQSSVHTNDQLIHRMYAHDIWMCYFPADTSHFLQPLDNVPFANFKRCFARLNQKACRLPHCSKEERYFLMIQAAMDAEHVSLSQNAIRKGFKNTGLVPFNRELILQNAVNAGPVDTALGPNTLPLLTKMVTVLDK